MPAYNDRIREVNVSKAKLFQKSEMIGPFNRGDTIRNKHFFFTFLPALVGIFFRSSFHAV